MLELTNNELGGNMPLLQNTLQMSDMSPFCKIPFRSVISPLLIIKPFFITLLFLENGVSLA
jgi:hypothetical protein